MLKQDYFTLKLPNESIGSETLFVKDRIDPPIESINGMVKVQQDKVDMLPALNGQRFQAYDPVKIGKLLAGHYKCEKLLWMLPEPFKILRKDIRVLPFSHSYFFKSHSSLKSR